MFKYIKGVIKSFLPWTEGNFSPMTNTSYGVKTMTTTDYIKLYTSWQYLAVSTIANSVSDLDRSLTRTKNDDKEINHKHFDLITFDLLLKITSSVQLTGSAFLYKNMIGNTVDSLEFLRTDLIDFDENGNGELVGYRYNMQNKYRYFQKDEIINISLYSPLQSYPNTRKGVSPMQAVAMQAEMDATANRWNWNFFKNGASAGDFFTTDKTLTEETKRRFVNRWRSEFQGVNNSHKVAIVDNNLQYNKVAVSQKELDFVESRRFTRDEVFAVFKVPASIVGVTENANRAIATTAERTYYKICISPIARMIEEAFNKHLFKDIGVFRFVNVIPSDQESSLLDYNSGSITLNEYRKELGMQPLKNGDFLKLSSMMIDTENQFQLENNDTKSNEYGDIVKKSLNKYTKGTQEYKNEREKIGEIKWKWKIKRTDSYEVTYINELKKIFDSQKASILESILSQKWQKTVKPPKDQALATAKWIVSLAPLYQTIFQNEWTQALNEIWINTIFQTWNPKANKWIKDNIALVAKEVNAVTKKKVFDLIAKWNDEWKGAVDIASQVSAMFEEFNTKRAQAIARTEITRASTESEIQAYEDSGVVEWKEWYTALDERTCPECDSMHGKTIGLRENYINKGEKYRGITYDYADVNGAPLHVNCRCTILPVQN